MSDKKDELIDLVMNQNVSGIQILADRLKISTEEVIELINELLEDGKLNGTLTEDGSRFFKSDVKLSAAPTIEREDAPPSFMDFNVKPAIATAVLGVIIIVFGLVINAITIDVVEQNFAAVLIFVGLMVLLAGLYIISRRNTPS